MHDGELGGVPGDLRQRVQRDALQGVSALLSLSSSNTVSSHYLNDTLSCEPQASPPPRPSQEADHRRWCSHVEIEVPAGVSRVPRGARSLRTGGSGQRQAQAQRQAQVQRQAFGSQQVASSRLVQRPR